MELCRLKFYVFTQIVLLIITISVGTGRFASTSNLKLGIGTIVSPADYSANKDSAASVAFGNNGTVTCNGVMVSNTTFLISTWCPPSFVPTTVAVGSIYFLTNPSFSSQSQVINVTSNATVYPNGAVTYETTGIPLGSQAVPAKLNPANTTVPTTTAECVTFGYFVVGKNNPDFQLNSLPANITDFATCNQTYNSVINASSPVFCARILFSDGTGRPGACAIEDTLVAVFCKQWLPNQVQQKFPPNQLLKEEVAKRCLFSFDAPFCHWICSLQWLNYPFCPPKKPQPPPSAPEPELESGWILAGINIQNPNHCATPPDFPYLFAQVTSV